MSKRIGRYRIADCLGDSTGRIARIELHVADLDEGGLSPDRLRHEPVEQRLKRIW